MIALLKNPFRHIQQRWATHKASGSTSNGRTSNPKYLGFKKMHGAEVKPGNVIVRQRGTQWHPGTAVGMGRDHTLFSLISGRVVVWYDIAKQRRYVSVDDGTLGPLPTRVEMKKKLADSIDAREYVKLDPVGRYEMTMQKIQELTDDMAKKRTALQNELMTQKGRRRFQLVDLTQVQ
ncbi:ribosomal L27 protein-domain-containing protein [Gorgonomyces haynaldii]|nr:ribosomal L27 protein-domain-containing protein [Gorgonomyces haynaldii]